MYRLSLINLFGEGAVQNGSDLIIKKNSLPLLTPLPENTASSLLVAILIKVLENFEGELNITDEYGNNITYNNRDAFELIEAFYWKKYIEDRNNANYVRDEIIIQTYDPN
jgi:hypothetical protein